MKNKFIYIALIAAGFISCEPEFENAVDANYTSGEADFSTYVAVGNSLTAGYMNGTMYKSGQQSSFPNLLAQKFALVGGGAFTQPSYEDDTNNLGGIAGIIDPATNQPVFKTRLVIDASQGRPENLAGTSTITLTAQAKAYNNMGVPGAKSFHLVAAGYGNALALPNANPYFVRHATTPNATILADAASLSPTFFTNWIGANDVLAFATSGGLGVDQTGNFNPATYGPNDITDPNVFANVYSTIINTLTTNGAKGVVATIPSVTSIPYFTTVPYNPLTSTTIGQGNSAAGVAAIGQLNMQLYGPLKQALTAFGAGSRINLLSTTGKNPLLIKDETLPDLSAQLTAAFTPSLGAATAAFYGSVFGQARQTTSADLVVLPASGKIGTAPTGVPAPLDKFGITYPLQDQDILLPSEQQAVSTATMAYNNAIMTIAATKGLAVADMNQILNALVGGIKVSSGQLYTANYFSGSDTEGKVLFSLDGVHPNPRGYAVIANEIIKVINNHYKSNLPFNNPGYYSGIDVVAVNN